MPGRPADIEVALQTSVGKGKGFIEEIEKRLLHTLATDLLLDHSFQM